MIVSQAADRMTSPRLQSTIEPLAALPHDEALLGLAGRRP